MIRKTFRVMMLFVLVLSLIPQTATAAPGQARYMQITPSPQTPQQGTSYESDLPQNQIDEVVEDASALAAGTYHTCALTSSGGVKCWGDNAGGHLGDGTTTQRSTPVNVIGLSSGVVTIAAGGYHTCVLTSNGGVKCWGSNGSGQLGDGSTTQRSTPVDVTGLSSGVIAIVAGGWHTCALTSSGGVKCWGNNSFGQLGDGTTTQRNTPVNVIGLSSGVIALATGEYHTCGIASGGGVKCWGDNRYGQLGDGTTTKRNTPVNVIGLSSGVIAIVAGGWHTCALTSSGGVKSWGNNETGQLGDGTTTQHSTPINVTNLSNGVTALVAGGWHTCALTDIGETKCWGDNTYGQLGDGTTIQRSVPINVVGLNVGSTMLTAGWSHTGAVNNNGEVKMWGANCYGQLGDGTIVQRNTPVNVVDLSSGITTLSAGYGHTCTLTNNGAVKCWGNNGGGQLGDNTTTLRSTPVNVFGLSNGAIALAAGGWHTCVVIYSGGVKCWGSNGSGQLGDGTTTQRIIPVDVVGLSSGVAALTIGGGHTCALTNSGGVKCWGANYYGQLGDGTTTQRNTPVNVISLSSGVIALAAGNAHTCALTINGGVKCWGSNWSGQLGDGTTTQRNTPVNVIGLSSGVIALTTGEFHTCVSTDSGESKCWGSNSHGQLGDGTTIGHSIPVNVIGLSNTAIALTAGLYHSCVLTSNGGIKCWGDNYYGQLGDDTTTQRSIPVDVVGLSSGVAALAAGWSHTCGAMSNGEAKCWGSDGYGQLGLGTIVYRTTPVDVVGFETLYSISGHVRDDSGQPIPGVTLSGSEFPDVVTDENGAYTIPDLEAGTYDYVPFKEGYVFTPEALQVTVPPDATGQDFVGTPHKTLKLLIVPLRWQNTQADFDREAQTQINLFVNEVPLNGCRERVLVETLDVVTQNYAGFTCSTNDCAVGSIRAFVKDQLQIDPAQYDVVVGLTETSPCAPTMGCSNHTDTIWITAQYDVVAAHELGHIYGLEDQYCSNQAGSVDERCNDGDIQGDGADSGDVNWLDASLPCDCPPDGANDSGNSSCCNFGGLDCSIVDYGVCCLGNKNAAGGRSTMSYADAPGPRGFDAHDLAHLNTIPMLSCESQTNLSQYDVRYQTESGSTRIINVDLLLHPDDSVTEEDISIGYGRPTSVSVLDNWTGTYTIQVVDVAGDIAWNQDFEVNFDYEGPVLLGVDYSAIAYDTANASFRIPAACGMSSIWLYHNKQPIFSQELPCMCIYLPLIVRNS